MKKNRKEYLEILKGFNGDISGRQKALSYISNSDVWVHGKPVAFSYVPNLVDQKTLDFCISVCEITHKILTKVIKQYLEDPNYRKVFNFPPEVERLITLPCDYSEMLPIARFDLFLDEEDLSFKFCEFNTDGSGAMSRDLETGHALQLGQTYEEFARRHEVEQFEFFDSWVKAFMANYSETPRAKARPIIAVTDFRESGVFSDFNRFIAAFERAGYSARFVDVREFVFDGEHLIDPSDGAIIDAVYRRAVTSEIIQHPGECNAFIDAVEARKVCIIGHFRTTVVHSKVVSIALFDKATREFLSEEECRFIDTHLPHTFRLRSDANIDFNEIKLNKDTWIIKPEDDYGAHSVYPGVVLSQAEWEKAVDRLTDVGYVVQEYYLPHKVDILLPQVPNEEKDFCKIEKWQSMPGMYVYNGNFQGLYCREGQRGIIALDHGGICAPSFKVDAK